MNNVAISHISMLLTIYIFGGSSRVGWLAVDNLYPEWDVWTS